MNFRVQTALLLSAYIALMCEGCASGGDSSEAGLRSFAQQVSPSVRVGTIGPSVATISVDLSTPRVQPSMSGFLLGWPETGGASQSLILPLRPAFWRASFNAPFDNYGRVSGLGLNTVWEGLISDSYGYPGDGLWNTTGSVQPPFNNAPYDKAFSAWNALTSSIVASNASRNMHWDIWNEPQDNPSDSFFWSGSAALYDQVYAKAYAVIRASIGGNAIVGGPDAVQYDKPMIQGLLDFCLANSCEVNYLSWHEANDGNIPLIAADINDARTTLLENPKYSALKIKAIEIQESVGPTSRYRPGDILGYLYYLEAGGADAAGKACWNSAAGANECFDNSVDGIIDPSTMKPRSAWWVYKLYADGVSGRVSSTTLDPHLVAIASNNSATPGVSQVIIGAFDINGVLPSTTSPTIALNGLESVTALRGLTSVHVRTTSIADTEAAPLLALPRSTDMVVGVNAGTATFSVNIVDHSVVLVLVSAN